MHSAHLNHAPSGAPAERLPVAALLALAMTGFVCIATETLPAGLLPGIGRGLDISESLAGQLVTSYAAGSVLAAIPLTIATQGWRRRNVLLLTIIGFLLFNSVTAWSSDYRLTIVARFCAGAAAGLAWSLLAGYARRMVAPHLQGRALAIAMVGTPVALSLGVPLGTWLGKSVGWRATFAAMSVLTLGLVAWVLAKVPDYPGQASARRQPLRAVLLTPGVRPVLAVVFTWMLAHNVLYTYIAPFLAPARMTDQVSSVLFIFGAAALAGIAATARAIDRHLRGAVRSSLAAFALTALAYALWPHSQGVILAGAALWGFSFGGAATLLQTALADAAEDGADVALSMNVVTWNAAIAGGGVTGGVLLDRFGSASFPCIVLVLTLAAFCIATACRVHGFPAGPRRSANGPAMH